MVGDRHLRRQYSIGAGAKGRGRKRQSDGSLRPERANGGRPERRPNRVDRYTGGDLHDQLRRYRHSESRPHVVAGRGDEPGGQLRSHRGSCERRGIDRHFNHRLPADPQRPCCGWYFCDASSCPSAGSPGTDRAVEPAGRSAPDWSEIPVEPVETFADRAGTGKDHVTALIDDVPFIRARGAEEVKHGEL